MAAGTVYGIAQCIAGSMATGTGYCIATGDAYCIAPCSAYCRTQGTGDAW